MMRPMKLGNGMAAPWREVPKFEWTDFKSWLLTCSEEPQRRIAAFFAIPEGARFRLVAVAAEPATRGFELGSAEVDGHYPALSGEIVALQKFERLIAERDGVVPDGHPYLQPVRRLRGDENGGDFLAMGGAAVHDVAVGPVHAGVIEPGHFRFECVGETVHSLEISLGYQHRGIESMLSGGPDGKTLPLMETADGSSSIAAATVCSRLIEALAGLEVSPGAVTLRAVALELERIANHVGDLGALAGDVAFLPTASFCGRIRGEYLNLTAELCGNRFGRGFVIPGGTRFGLDRAGANRILERMRRVKRDLDAALKLFFDSPTVLDRLENTGRVSRETALHLGAVGPAARASGVARDARCDFGWGEYAPYAECGCVTEEAGDVLARARVRLREVDFSHRFLKAVLSGSEWLPVIAVPRDRRIAPAADSIAVSAVEGWRGEHVHVALTGGDGRFRAYRIIDPSLRNWEMLAMAMRGEEISNFPICNKSFNLSYCGHDL